MSFISKGDDMSSLKDIRNNARKINNNVANIQSNIRDMNNNFTTCRYEPEDDLTILQRKILNRIDVEFAHKNPDAKLQVFLDTYGKYNMEYSGGSVKILKTCDNKEKCFDKLKDFIMSIQAMPI